MSTSQTPHPVEADAEAVALAANELSPDSILERIRRRYEGGYDLAVHHRTRPDPALDPVVIAEFDAKPANAAFGSPRLWCSHCERVRFWKGVAVTDSGGGVYLIGSKCGKDHYQGRFAAALATFRRDEERRRIEDRLRAIAGLSSSILAACDSVVGADELVRLDAARKEFEQAGDFKVRLNAKASNDLPLTVSEPYVDRGRETFRERSVGKLAGAALVAEVGKEHDYIDSARAALGALSPLMEDLDGANSRTVIDCTRAAEDALAGLSAALTEARNVHRFFAPNNLDRVAAFAEKMRRFYSITVDGDHLVVVRDGAIFSIRPIDLRTLSIPRVLISWRSLLDAETR